MSKIGKVPWFDTIQYDLIRLNGTIPLINADHQLWYIAIKCGPLNFQLDSRWCCAHVPCAGLGTSFSICLRQVSGAAASQPTLGRWYHLWIFMTHNSIQNCFLIFWDVCRFKSKHAATPKWRDCPHLHPSVCIEPSRGWPSSSATFNQWAQQTSLQHLHQY